MSEQPTFLNLLDQLTKETPTFIRRDAGMELKQRIGLLQQLREAVFGGMESTGGSSQFGSRPPIDPAAVDLLTEITDQAAQVLAKVTHTPTPYGHAEHYVRLWAGQVTEGQAFTVTSRATINNARQYASSNPGKPTVYDSPAEYTAYGLLARWVERIEDFFNPPSSKEIKAPCPNCGERYMHRMKDGELVRSAALNIHRDKETGVSIEARCSVCARSWPRSQFEFLAEMIGATPIPEMSVAHGIVGAI